MNKAQALDNFYNQFGIPAYDINSVPDNATYPYITYEVREGKLEDEINLTASIWYRSDSWRGVEEKANEIARYLGYGGQSIKLDNGYLYICQGVPFAQRMNDPLDDAVKRMYLNLQAEFLTGY